MANSRLFNTNRPAFFPASLFAGIVLFLVGCNDFEGAGVDEKVESSDSLEILEAEVFELYSLAPCTESHDYCSFPFLVEQVDALIAGYCLDGDSQEALRIYTFFAHFQDPSPRLPDC